MAVLSRIELINEGKYRAGIDATNVELTTEFDMALKDITGRYDILRGNAATGTLTSHATNNYLAVPSDFKGVEHMKVSTTAAPTVRTEVVMLEPEIFFSYALSVGTTYLPTKGCYVPTEGRIYLNPFPSADPTVTYYLWYTKYHPAVTTDAGAHILGEEFDETIALGLAAYAAEMSEKYQRALWFRQTYEEDLGIKATVKRKRMIRVEYPEM